MPYGMFGATDGPRMITVGNNCPFLRFYREVIEHPCIADDERYQTHLARRDIRGSELTREITRRLRQVLLECLTAAGIPCAEVLGLHEALTSPRAAAGSLVTHPPHPEAGTTPVLSPPDRLDGARPPVSSDAAPEPPYGVLAHSTSFTKCLLKH